MGADIAKALAKPEFAHGMQQIGRGADQISNYFRSPQDQIRLPRQDPHELLKGNLLRMQMQQIEDKRKKEQMAAAARQALMTPTYRADDPTGGQDEGAGSYRIDQLHGSMKAPIERYGVDPLFLQAFPNAAEKIMSREPSKGFSLSPGARRYDAQGNEIAAAPAKPMSPRDRAFSQLSPEDQRRIMLKPLASTNITTGETVDNKLLGMDLSTIKAMQESVNANKDLVPKMTTVALGLESGNVKTGKLREATQGIRQWAHDLGWLEDPDLPQEQQVSAAMAFMIPRMRVTGSGSTSDKEMDKFAEATANFGYTTAGNVLIARSFLQIQRRNQRAVNLAKQYVRKNKTMEGFDEHADRVLGPIFPIPKTAAEHKKLKRGTVYLDPTGRFKVKRR